MSPFAERKATLIVIQNLRDHNSLPLDNPNIAILHAAAEGLKPDRTVGCLRAFEAVRRWAVDLLLVDRLVPIQLHGDDRLRRLLSAGIESRRREVDVERLPHQRRQARIRHFARVGKNTSTDARRVGELRVLSGKAKARMAMKRRVVWFMGWKSFSEPRVAGRGARAWPRGWRGAASSVRQ